MGRVGGQRAHLHRSESYPVPKPSTRFVLPEQGAVVYPPGVRDHQRVESFELSKAGSVMDPSGRGRSVRSDCDEDTRDDAMASSDVRPAHHRPREHDRQSQSASSVVMYEGMVREGWRAPGYSHMPSSARHRYYASHQHHWQAATNESRPTARASPPVGPPPLQYRPYPARGVEVIDRSQWSRAAEQPPAQTYARMDPIPERYYPHKSVDRPVTALRTTKTRDDIPVSVSNDDSPTAQVRPEENPKKRPAEDPVHASKRSKGFEMLDLLVSATLEIGPMTEHPAGCSCPKSKCIALYCDCFKAGRRCDPSACSCLDCKNTINESGPEGARTKAIRSILARNPRAFLTAGQPNVPPKLPPGEVACNCVRSRCLKLYCTCFQAGKVCKPEVCSCVGCRNLENDEDRQHAIQVCLEKRPDAFQVKVKPVGRGCACKNNRCIRKYCECFREKMKCSSSCSCVSCENGGVGLEEAL